MSSIYKINNFSFSYPKHTQQLIHLPDKLLIENKDFILLQGSSGSGKSTLLFALRGLLPMFIHGLVSGEIYFKGINLAKSKEISHLPISYLNQNPDSQIICDNVFRELSFGLENQGLSSQKVKDKVNYYADMYNITHLLTRNVLELSSGEKQKVNLLALLLLEPDVLLLDEPMAFLDHNAVNDFRLMLHQYALTKTIVMSEHNVSCVQDIINRSIVIKDDGLIMEENVFAIDYMSHFPELPCKFFVQSKNQQILKIKDLSFGYSTSQLLLNNLNFDLNYGEIIAITGSNGSGKSTLLKLLGGIISGSNFGRTSKSIFWYGKCMNEITRNQLWKHVKLLWQNSDNYFFNTMVSKELSYNEELLNEFGLVKYANHSPFSLSQGQKRRLAIAIALLSNADIFLLDEPTFGQDFNAKYTLATLISKLMLRGKSFIIVSHDLMFLNALTTNIYSLTNGELIKC